MRIMYADLVAMENQLQKISIAEQKIPIRTALKFYHNLVSVETALEPCKRMRNDIVTKYGSPKEGCTEFADFQKAIQELLMQDTEIELEKVYIGEIENMELTMHQITAIYPMIDEGGETNG